MKLQYDPNLEYQQEAVRAVTDLFDGQEVCDSNFSVPSFDVQGLMQNETELGYGNKLHLLDEEILENLNKSGRMFNAKGGRMSSDMGGRMPARRVAGLVRFLHS